MRFTFESEGYEVMTAADGYEALGAARVTAPDFILLDVMLPKVNGYLISRCVKEDIKKGVYGKDIPVLLLTARVLDGHEREEMFLKTSAADLMVYKPFKMEELVEKVKELLAQNKERHHG